MLYWILRMDTLVLVLGLLIGITLAATIVLGIAGASCIHLCATDSECCPDEPTRESVVATGKKCFRLARIASFLCVLAIVLKVLCPTTQQAAMIYVVPAVANDPQVRTEASELYQLAKEGLRNMVTVQNLDWRPSGVLRRLLDS
jgi:hypothetical protein